MMNNIGYKPELALILGVWSGAGGTGIFAHENN